MLALAVGALAAPAALGVSGSDTITTSAGTGTAGFVGEGGQATSAQLSYPWGVAIAGENVYVVDNITSRIRKVSGGIITTIAGTGTPGYSGDGGQATSAQLYYPEGVAVDGQGNLYIADAYNQRVRKITPAGIITTIAGTGTAGYSGDGGQATSAQLNYPGGVAVDTEGDLFIADESNSRIRKVTPGGVITTAAGNGTPGYSGDGGQATSAQLNFPYGVAVDPQGNLYVADTSNYRIRKVTSDGTITTFAGTGTFGFSGDGGPATSAQMTRAFGVALDTAGNVYFGDQSNFRIRKVDRGGTIATVAGTGAQGFSGDGGPALSAQIGGSRGLASSPQGLYFSDYGGHRVRLISNRPPSASIDASPASGQAPLNASFSGSGSDPDGSVVSYAWNFGDNTTASARR